MKPNEGAGSNADDAKIRVALYARVNSPLDSLTLDSQVAAMREYVEGLPQHTVGDVYAEEGKPARKGRADSRPQFRRMMSDAKAGSVDLVLTVSVDRLTRSIYNMIQIVTELKEYGVGLKTLHETLDFGGPMGEFMLTQLAAAEQLRSYLMSNNAERGQARKKGQGIAG